MYDIAIVGSGIAASMTLCQLADRLVHEPRKRRPVRICVIEREEQVWTGIPYGRRSTTDALTFQKLNEFLDEPERSDFVRWLVTHAESWMQTLRESSGSAAATWLADNRHLMESNEWGELYLPRFLFGLYVSETTSRAVEALESSGSGNVTVVHGEASACTRLAGSGYQIAIEKADGTHAAVQAARVVLAIGSPPQQRICDSELLSRGGHTHIADLYAPSEDSNMKRVEQVFETRGNSGLVNVLIVGSNASALEVLYLLHHRPAMKRKLGSVLMLSRSGMLPYRICDQEIAFELSALDGLSRGNDFSAADVMSAIVEDVRRAEQSQLNIADLRDPVGAAVSRLTDMLSIREQETFVCEYGVHYSRLMRRAGRDTHTAADELMDAGILQMLKGEFRRLEPCDKGDGRVRAVYADTVTGKEVVCTVPFTITVNCGGFEELDVCSSPFINSVVENGICQVNRTNRGFLLNERLEASEGVYVIGPLAAGNFNAKLRYWHVESAWRISGLARMLACSLCESLQTDQQQPALGNVSLLDGATPAARTAATATQSSAA